MWWGRLWRSERALVGDINGDGYADLIAPKSFGQSSTAWLGTRSGRLREPVQLETGLARVTDLGDLDGDGADDLLANAEDGRSVAVLTLLTRPLPDPPVVEVVRRGRGLAVPGATLLPDLDGDGDGEIAISSTAPVRTMIFRGTGSAFEFDAAWTIPGATSVAAADIDGDGLLDLITGDADYTGSFEREGRVEVRYGHAVCGIGLPAWEQDP